MTIPPDLAAVLDLLTQALDLPGTDVAETLTRLAADAQTAVDSYLGLSVQITAGGSDSGISIVNEGTQPEHVLTSLLIPLSAPADPAGPAAGTTPASVALILYAATPGAFVDLAADLSWITGRALEVFRLDEHRALAESHTNPTRLAKISDINQALGLLIGRGSTPEQAERDLHARAAAAGIDLFGAATLTLATLTPPDAKPAPP